MELKNRSFQYGKVALAVRTQLPSVTVCAQSGRHLHRHLHVFCADRTFSAAAGLPVCLSRGLGDVYKRQLRNRALDFVEICNICVRKAIIKAAKRIINSDEMCRSYNDLNYGVTFLEHSVYWWEFLGWPYWLVYADDLLLSLLSGGLQYRSIGLLLDVCCT